MKQLLYSTLFVMAAIAAVWSVLPAESAEPPATTTITLTIPTAKLPQIIAAFKGIYPIPLIDDPEHEGEDDPEQIPKYTDNQWAKQCLRAHIIRTDTRWRQKVANEAAKVTPDDTLAE